MKIAFKFVSGTACALALLWLAVFVYGLGAIYLPIPNSWWREYPAAVSYGAELLSFLLFAIVGAFAARFAFGDRAARWSFLCFFAAFIIGFSSIAFESGELFLSGLRVAVEVILIFVVGVPAVLLVYQHAR